MYKQVYFYATEEFLLHKSQAALKRRVKYLTKRYKAAGISTKRSYGRVLYPRIPAQD